MGYIRYDRFEPVDPAFLRDCADFPPVEKITCILEQEQREHPESCRCFSPGKSIGGIPLPAVEVTDFSVPDEDKFHVVFCGAEHGTEKNAALVLLAAVEKLLSGTEHVRELLRRCRIVLLPVINADGYTHFAFPNRNHINLFSDYDLKTGPSQPESQALAAVLEELQPELFVSVHGHPHRDGYCRLVESTGIARSERVCRCCVPELVERANAAAEAAGFPQERGEADVQRVLGELPDDPAHSFGAHDSLRRTSPTWAYSRYHSCAMSMEVNFVESGLLRLMAMLDFLTGPEFPPSVVSSFGNLFLLPGGKNLSEKRKNRIVMWGKVLANTMIQAIPERSGFFFGGAAIGKALRNKLHGLSERPYVTAPPTAKVWRFIAETTGTKYDTLPPECRKMLDEAEAGFLTEPALRFHPEEGADPALQEITLALRMPENDRPVRCWIDGQEIPADRLEHFRTHGWCLWLIPLRFTGKEMLGTFAMQYIATERKVQK